MLKLLLPLVILCGAITSHANEIAETIQKTEMRAEEMAMAYTGFGCGHILTGHYRDALIALDLADVQLASLDTHAPAVDFMIAFARIVAYDNLRMREECERAIGLLFISLSRINAGDEDEEEDDDQDHDTLIDDFFQRLASSCANREVRNLLMSVVEEMEKD